jgi:leucine dehydrogenase
VNRSAADRVQRELGAMIVEPAAIHMQEGDLFVPCALGGILNSGTIPELRVEIVAGAANNQLLEASDAARLEARGILYVPDYIANAGGVINGSRELLGWTAERARVKVEAIYDTVLEVIRLARDGNMTTAAAADGLALSRLGMTSP